MKFKMRVLCSSPSGKGVQLASAIARDQKTVSDQIPPAYPVSNEKLLFIGMESKGTIDKAVVNLCKDLNTDRVKNVAFFVVNSGSPADIDEITKELSSKEIAVIGDVYQCTAKSGIFSKGTVSDENINGAVEWARKIVDSL